MAKKARTAGRVQQLIDDGIRRVAIYIRRSTDVDHQPFSLEAQATKLRAFVSSQPRDWQMTTPALDVPLRSPVAVTGSRAACSS